MCNRAGAIEEGDEGRDEGRYVPSVRYVVNDGMVVVMEIEMLTMKE
jgi:hypothetical protein